MTKKCHRGFVLVTTLWILAIITIAAGYFAERVSQSIELAQQKQDTTQQLVEFANTKADILYRLGTTPFGFDGLGRGPAIALDDRPYRGSGEDFVRLQDSRGLINVNFVESRMISCLLGQLGVPMEKRVAMLDTLLDYTDNDDLRRLNGAELAEYTALGLPPPSNDWLLIPHQLINIIGWRDKSYLWENQNLLRFVTSSRIFGLNPNTAPPEILNCLPGISPGAAETLVKMRTEKPFLTSVEFAKLYSGFINTDYLLFFPGNSLRITHQSRKLPWTIQFSLTLTPMNEENPWRIDYQAKIPVTYKIDNVDKIHKLPAKTSTVSDKDETF